MIPSRYLALSIAWIVAAPLLVVGLIDVLAWAAAAMGVR